MSIVYEVVKNTRFDVSEVKLMKKIVFEVKLMKKSYLE